MLCSKKIFDCNFQDVGGLLVRSRDCHRFLAPGFGAIPSRIDHQWHGRSPLLNKIQLSEVSVSSDTLHRMRFRPYPEDGTVQHGGDHGRGLDS